MRVYWVVVGLLVGCGGATTKAESFHCAEDGEYGYPTTCSPPSVVLGVNDESSVRVASAQLDVDDVPARQGFHVLSEGEHNLSVELQLAPAAGRGGALVAAAHRFSLAAGCQLSIEVAVDVHEGAAPHAVRFDEILRCENSVRAQAAIPPPPALAALPSPMRFTALEQWGAACVEDARVAQRYVALAAEAALELKDIIVGQCLSDKGQQIDAIRDGLEGSMTFTPSSPAEMTRDAQIASWACLLALDLQAEAKQCI